MPPAVSGGTGCRVAASGKGARGFFFAEQVRRYALRPRRRPPYQLRRSGRPQRADSQPAIGRPLRRYVFGEYALLDLPVGVFGTRLPWARNAFAPSGVRYLRFGPPIGFLCAAIIPRQRPRSFY